MRVSIQLFDLWFVADDISSAAPYFTDGSLVLKQPVAKDIFHKLLSWFHSAFDDKGCQVPMHLYAKDIPVRDIHGVLGTYIGASITSFTIPKDWDRQSVIDVEIYMRYERYSQSYVTAKKLKQ